MSISFTMFDNEIREFITSNFPDKTSTKILDVGVGAGKFRQLLYDYVLLDGVEAWQSTIDQYYLRSRYNRLFAYRIQLLRKDYLQSYDLVIFGDVLEHMNVEEAQTVLNRCKGTVLIAVPYEYEQGEVDGNPFEKHLQDDLTHEIFMERYPGFSVLVKNDQYGVYVRGHTTIEKTMKQPEQKQLIVDTSIFEDVNLLIATPSGSGSCTMEYAMSLAKTVKKFDELKIKTGLLMTSGHSVQAARNRLVSSFMSEKHFSHMIMIDTDHGWEPENILRLLAMDKDIIGIIARKKTPQVEWAANIPKGDIEIIDGAMKLDSGMGTGFLMFKRKVFAKMMENYPELKIPHPDEAADDLQKDNYYALFQWLIDKEGIERSEDLTFCQRWQDIGGEIWCDPGAAISHIGSYDYRGSVSSIFKGIAA